MSTKKVAILLMAFGTPNETADILPYYTHIRHGHQPNAALLEALQRRYDAIGGTSPLAEITLAQVAGVRQAFMADTSVTVFLGLRHIAPFIEDVAAEIGQAGYQEVYGLSLMAHYSTYSTKDYHQVARQSLKVFPEVQYHEVNGFDQMPTLEKFWAQQIQQLQVALPQQTTKVIFSAHSLPLKTAADDPYSQNVLKNAAAIAKLAQLNAADYTVTWQSAGRTAEPWIGPSLTDVVAQVLTQGTVKQILSVPIGFINDNLEINYDLDIELAKQVETLGGHWHRAAMPNDDPALIEALVQRLKQVMD
ncbi:ferrochelatase [Agrilactobacillus yilanensis]|uniref:Coproporphyrin III ferrochelatase n=1 Tax=Agrilactobacillus yilanensis TaxID=2485997 RepID=A0ABW4JCE2_9LACO|nr:ferrochelatase [Agrilactobacillus yilanensis]